MYTGAVSTRHSVERPVAGRSSASDRLVAAMQECLWVRGYAATSPRTVMQAAGVGQGSMYHHFRGKRDLALAALTRTCDEMVAGLHERLVGTDDPVERVDRFLARPRAALAGCRVGRMTQDPQVVADPELLAPIARTFAVQRRLLADALREAAAIGRLRADTDPDELAAALSAIVQGAFVLGRADQSQAAYDAAIMGGRALLRAAAVPPPRTTPTRAAYPPVTPPESALGDVVPAVPSATPTPKEVSA